MISLNDRIKFQFELFILNFTLINNKEKEKQSSARVKEEENILVKNGCN